MKFFISVALILCTCFIAFGQNEQSPIVEKEIEYKDWTYKSIRTGESLNLRQFAKGKKLVMVVYFAPWCGNWKHDAPILQRWHEKYQSKGLGIVAVGEYDPVSAMTAGLDALNVTFPAVHESENRTEKQNTLHYKYRRSTGDNRNWGSPWYIFLTPAMIEKQGDVLTRKAFVVNGEVIETEGEAFIRKALGSPASAAGTAGTVAENGKIEVCDANPAPIALKKP